ncbi:MULTISPECIES: ParB N-terminal domain-containing protein [unclassified Streptomyces]|uniref:ParB/RepB/Spo0J family partition protein n=1 Tax=unclassified Streptomyces TaxID=2593676 RepID=UPI002024FF50|nr:ParB N-terminal domain-containing protein [Streptomyces sp. A 4/2]WSV58968.1 ParB N-terminal domain-containing protein [Streptomyces sp. NBC_01014]
MAAGRRTSLASLAGQKVDDVPGKSDPLLLTLPLQKLVPTRFNPRRNFGTDEDLRDFGLKLKKRQLQPAVVVSRPGYLKLWPEEEEHVGAVPYVIANGERRFRGSLAAGLTTLNVVHNEDVANSRADFLDAVLSENNDREDLDPIERAIGIEIMVAELGGADRVANHYGKTKGWVSQQRKLLKLTPELQAFVSTGEIAIRIGRELAGLPAAEQFAAWEDEQKRRLAVQSAPRAPRSAKKPDEARTPEQPAERFTAVNQPGSQASQAERFTAVNQPERQAPPVERFTAVNRSAPQPSQAQRFTAVNQDEPQAPVAAGAVRSQRPEAAGELVPAVPAQQHEEAPLSELPLVASPAQAVDVLARIFSPADLTAVAELLLDRIGSDHALSAAAAAEA